MPAIAAKKARWQSALAVLAALAEDEETLMVEVVDKAGVKTAQAILQTLVACLPVDLDPGKIFSATISRDWGRISLVKDAGIFEPATSAAKALEELVSLL